MNREHGAKAPVFEISGARKSLTEDVRGRQRRYVLSMSIRTVCFLLAVVLSGPLRWVMLAGAVLLPYVAVVVANGGRSKAGDAPLSQVVPPQAHRAIEAPPEAVLTSAERHDIKVTPEDAWIVPDDADPGAAKSAGHGGVWVTTVAGTAEHVVRDAPGQGRAEAGPEGPAKPAPGTADGPPEGNRQ
ncbi:DUF3099 domain-containing protein [Yinghuangia soli]|uniref:DUF3099 domain-containing protein n=1 Tax=Yinghuangia soli TaxID=2908204 RepID=UPI0027E31D51|nr:DUF3099 domain-containing protein [Yinghuangia soli]